MFLRQGPGDGFDFCWAEIVGGSVDEVAPEGDGLGDPMDLGRVDAFRRYEERSLRYRLAVAP